MHCAALQCRAACKASADHKQNTTVTRNNFARRSCKHTAISICLLRRQHLFRLRARQRSALAKTKGSLSFRPAHPRPKRIEHLPVLRPLCGFDKNEIIERSKQIGTYDTSILPYEDCCTVFLPKHPVTKPKLADVLAEEAKLDVAALVDEALATTEVIKL